MRVLRGPWAAETAGRDVMVLWSGVDPDADDITLAHWHESGVPVIISAPAADLSLVGEQLGLGFD